MSNERAGDKELALPALPSGWVWASIEEIRGFGANDFTDGPFGSKLKTKDYVPDGFRVIRLGNIGIGCFKPQDQAFISPEKFASLKKHEVFPGDLVIAALAEPVGRAMLVPSEVCPAVVKADCIRLKPAPGIFPVFVMHALNSPGGIRRTESFSHGIGRLRINMGNLRALPVPIAPQNEQRRIVAKIETLQDRSRRAREALEAVPPLLEKFRQSVLAAAFRGDLTADWRAQNPDVEPASELLKRIRVERRCRWEEAELAKLEAKGKVPQNEKWKAKYKEPVPPDTSDLPELPSGWVWTSLDELAVVIRNGISTPPKASSGIPVLRISSVRAFQLNLNDVRFLPHTLSYPKQFEVQPGDLLYTRYNGNPELVGACAQVPDQVGKVLYPDKLIRVVIALPDLSWFFQAASAAGESRAHIRSCVKTSAGQAGISGSDLKRMPIPLASEREAIRIASLVQAAWNRVIRLRDISGSIKLSISHLDQSILQKAFQGKLVPQDPNDESAADLLERIRREREAVSPKKSARRRKKKEAAS